MIRIIEVSDIFTLNCYIFTVMSLSISQQLQEVSQPYLCDHSVECSADYMWTFSYAATETPNANLCVLLKSRLSHKPLWLSSFQVFSCFKHLIHVYYLDTYILFHPDYIKKIQLMWLVCQKMADILYFTTETQFQPSSSLKVSHRKWEMCTMQHLFPLSWTPLSFSSSLVT